jgi:hypothetical protein
MSIIRNFGGNRGMAGLLLIGFAVSASGCGSSGEANFPVPEGTPPGQLEQEARLKAYGTIGNPQLAKNTKHRSSKRGVH